MLYELREYEPVRERRAVLLRRFVNHTLRLFRAHGMTVCGFWEEASSGNLVYLLGFESREHFDRAWLAFRTDPRWLEVKAASESKGPLVNNMTSRLLEAVEIDDAPIVQELS